MFFSFRNPSCTQFSSLRFPFPNRPPKDAKSQEDTVPAPEAASATVQDVKDVGGGLVGDFVARCWITMDDFVTKEKYVL